MKITIKTLQQKVFQIDAEGSETVGDLKSKIQQTQGHALETQKLIFSGKVLADSKTIESCDIKEKDFLVLMVSKPKATPAASSSSAAASSAPVPAPAPEIPAAAPPAPAVSVPSPAPTVPQPPNAPILTPAPVASTPEAQRAFDNENAFVTGVEFQATVNGMMEMGFEREQVIKALRASFNNPERAVEYLFNGIPAHLEETARGPQGGAPQGQTAGGNLPAHPAPIPVSQLPQAPPRANQNQNLFQLAQQQQQQNPPPQAPHGAGGQGQSIVVPVGPGGTIDIQAMQQHPQIQALRQLMEQNPQAVQVILQQIATQNPQLVQLFAQHPEQLAQLLGVPENAINFDALAGAIDNEVIELTQEEAAVVERLMGLGFPRERVVEAYLACDKNEELAANYLFESGFEDD
ncbi:hypothetical protein EW026_g1837 [Hermanssonia centrifuga]|uniref:UV excision repair protein RAD23 n=1 Tax=Hermanssonia centrifuga TaxID=98765 RepID=A0A4S4KR28_9APHY|nr:hypothetical protein EW026_g1837 [Hermanssonia centrifuga]